MALFIFYKYKVYTYYNNGSEQYLTHCNDEENIVELWSIKMANISINLSFTCVTYRSEIKWKTFTQCFIWVFVFTIFLNVYNNIQYNDSIIYLIFQTLRPFYNCLYNLQAMLLNTMHYHNSHI